MICGTPTPATTRVVQIDPGPIPTLTTSAPASINARVASAVATFPAIISKSGKAARISCTVLIHLLNARVLYQYNHIYFRFYKHFCTLQCIFRYTDSSTNKQVYLAYL